MIEFRKINRFNFEEVMKLKLKEEQKYFINDITLYLASAYVFDECKPLSIYYKEDLVGFLMVRANNEDRSYWIDCFFIRAEEQQKGYGSWALKKIISILKEDKENNRINILINENNHTAVKLLAKVGFKLSKINNSILAEIKY